MEKEKRQQVKSMELPSIKKIVYCPRCNAKIEYEFEIGMDMIMPELAKASLPTAPSILFTPSTKLEEDKK